jgi:hypothetical protein
MSEYVNRSRPPGSEVRIRFIVMFFLVCDSVVLGCLGRNSSEILLTACDESEP